MGVCGEPALTQIARWFADGQAAHDFFVRVRWPHGIVCPRAGCGSENVVRIGRRNAWRCRGCARQFTAKVGTILENSPIGFDKWLPVIWVLAREHEHISSGELARALNVTQKTAWYMIHRVRIAANQEKLANGGALFVPSI